MKKRFLWALLLAGIVLVPQISSAMVFPGADWKECKPEAQGVDSTKLNDAINYLGDQLAERGGISELVIIRNGYMIHKGSNIDRKHCVWSATKSFASTVLGHLIDKGKCSLDTLAKDHVSLLQEKYPEVTLRHFATMTSGYDAVNPNNKGYGDDPDDGSRSPFVPADPVFVPGTKFSYFDDAMFMNGYVLTKIAGADLESYFRKHIARPIGMKDSGWQWAKDHGKPVRDLSNPDGVDVRGAPGGMNITAREMARFGHLFLNSGNWNGKRIISSKWVNEATRVQVPPTMKYRDDSSRQRRLGSRGVGRYGYNWWVNGVGQRGKRLWPDAPAGAYYANGYNNNVCIVIPEWNMVIVRMGTSGYPRRHIEVWNTFLKKVGEAVVDKPVITGKREVWRTATISFSGPQASESDKSPNPFLDCRLQVKFTGPSGQIYNVPGYFDGNGRGQGKGNVWRVRFTPDEVGSWSYNASFRQGKAVAIDLKTDAGKVSRYINGTSGEFDVAARNGDADGFLSKGRLVYKKGSYYLKTLGDGKYWIKGGTDSPENFLAYNGFVNTTGRDDKPEWFHDFDRHIKDWNNGDPDWDGGKGKGIIGSLNYLSSKHVNSIYVLLMNIGGDGHDVWPYSGRINRAGAPDNDNVHFDIAKLVQWEIVFDHAQRKGINLNFTLNEGEKNNKRELDNAQLGTERKLYYREMIARFGHHNALQWMLCEEYDHPDGGGGKVSPDMIKSWARYIKKVDAYRHPVSIHNMRKEVLEPFFGSELIDLTSYQYHNRSERTTMQSYSVTVELLREQTAAAGKKIPIVIDEPETVMVSDDENVGQNERNRPHGYGQVKIRKEVLYPILFSGGSVEFILEDTLATDDFRRYESLWNYTYFARKFMEENLPFWEMRPHDELLTGEAKHAEVLARPAEIYAIYFPDTQNTGKLDLRGHCKTFNKRWYNPRTGDFEGAISTVKGGGNVPLGAPPHELSEDWVLLLKLGTEQVRP